MIWIVSFVTVAATGWAVYLHMKHRAMMRRFERTSELYADACDTLQALRRNCFITNERGHRVKYRNASPEARAKAERI